MAALSRRVFSAVSGGGAGHPWWGLYSVAGTPRPRPRL